MQRGTGGQRHINTSPGQSVGHLSYLHPRIVSVCLPAHPKHGDEETFELSLRQTLQIGKSMQQAWEEGRGKRAGWGNSHSTRHRFGAGEKSKPGAAHAPEQSPLILTSPPHLYILGRISMGLLVQIPQASLQGSNSKAWAGKPLPSLSKALLSTIHKGRD